MSAIARRTIPRAVVLASRIDAPARASAAVRRRLGGSGRVELFFAFDDPASAVAVLDLAERVAARDVLLDLLPVVRRGIADDPAVERKRKYALVDARRLARRSGLTLSRTEPLPPAATAFLAEWVAGAVQGPALTSFCVEAMRDLWFSGDGPVDRGRLAILWRRELGGDPPRGRAEAVSANERRMGRRGPYDTPAAWVAGEWFFAHDRPAQIAARLDDLGWVA